MNNIALAPYQLGGVRVEKGIYRRTRIIDVSATELLVETTGGRLIVAVADFKPAKYKE